VKGEFLIGEGDQSVVGDGYAMGVTAQIAEHILRSSERSFRVDHPVLSTVVSATRKKFYVE
jgi:hypothetical protein